MLRRKTVLEFLPGAPMSYNTAANPRCLTSSFVVRDVGLHVGARVITITILDSGIRFYTVKLEPQLKSLSLLFNRFNQRVLKERIQP